MNHSSGEKTKQKPISHEPYLKIQWKPTHITGAIEIKHGKNTASDKQTTPLSILEGPKVLYKLTEPRIISSAGETWLSLDGYSAPCFGLWWREKCHQTGTERELRTAGSFTGHSSGNWKLGIILIFTVQSAAMWGKHLNLHKMLYLKVT